MTKQETLYGLARDKRRGVVFLYTKRSSRLFYALKFLLLAVASPIWVPLYALIWLGIRADQALDCLSPIVDWVLVKIVPRKL